MIKEYQNHIDTLAKQLNCKLVQKDDLPGMMFVESGYVEIPTVKNQIHYLTGLHELAHFANGHTQGRPPHEDQHFYFDNGVLKSEAEAWEGALGWCIDEIQEESRRFMWDYCLGSYYQCYLYSNGRKTQLLNGNRHHISFVYDHPDEFFSSIVKRIQGNIIDYKIKYIGKY